MSLPTPSPATTTTQILSTTTALLASGGIASLSIFTLPILQSLPAPHSLPSTRWLFSRGSHIFPTAGFASASGFLWLAYESLPASTRSVAELGKVVLGMGTATGWKPEAYLLAAVLTMGIAPITQVMIPTNFALIALNEKAGGARSAASAEQQASRPGGRVGDKTAEESVNGEDAPSQLWDLSGPQREVVRGVSAEEEERVRELLARFKWMNLVRAGVMAVGGMVGVWAAVV